jgi:hypothetical protein
MHLLIGRSEGSCLQVHVDNPAGLKSLKQNQKHTVNKNSAMRMLIDQTSFSSAILIISFSLPLPVMTYQFGLCCSHGCSMFCFKWL